MKRLFLYFSKSLKLLKSYKYGKYVFRNVKLRVKNIIIKYNTCFLDAHINLSVKNNFLIFFRGCFFIIDEIFYDNLRRKRLMRTCK